MPRKKLVLPRPPQPLIFKSFDELNGHTLVAGDRVVFGTSAETIEYEVLKDRLMKTTDGPSIFKLANLNSRKASRRAYGYDGPLFGDWPKCLPDDMDALTRLCLIIFAALSGWEAIEMRMPNRHWKHINVLKLLA